MITGSARITSALSQCPLFYGRPIHALVPTCAMHSYRAGQPVFRAGEAATHLVVLVTGRIETFTTRLNGEQNPLAVHRAPDAVVEVGVFASDRTRRWGATASTDAEVVLVPHDALLRAAADDAVLTDRLLTMVADTAGRTDEVRPDADVAQRLLGCLHRLADTFGVPQPDGSVLVGLRVSLTDLGALIAASRPEVGTAMKSLETAGEIERLGDYYLLARASGRR